MGYYASQAAEETKLIGSGHGILCSVFVFNVSASAKYVFIFDNTSATGTILAGPFPVEANQGIAISFTDSPVEFALGAFVASSTSASTYAASGTADFRINSYTTSAA